MEYLESELKLGEVIPNIAQMLNRNAQRLSGKQVFCEKQNGRFEGITWAAFYADIQRIAANLKQFGFGKGDKMVVFSPNRLEMLELELAVMASGGVSVPIFAYFNAETAGLLIRHSDAKFLTLAGAFQLERIRPDLPLQEIFVFDPVPHPAFKNLHPFSQLLLPNPESKTALDLAAKPDDICLNMYTSGTMGTPKCVQLTHRNILSQQNALEQIWNLDEHDRFLSYLPWHHSFGGIFERFTALCSGATMYLEPGYGKDPNSILENWNLVQPTLFFSVPKVYQALIQQIRTDKAAEEDFFHQGLRFVFTAAASLPQKISDAFEKRNIPVIEGWGLTETAPCCTLTDPKLKRENGVVGKPIPGVSIRIAEDGEIQVKGPNVMVGYYKNDEANRDIFTPDGWYCTGDVGEFTAAGLKLISRKDRIFKLTNGEKVIPTEMEGLIQSKCHYVMYAMVVGGGSEFPVAILFPNKKMLENPNYEVSPEEGCFCPRNVGELGKCLHGCLHNANCGLLQKFSKIKYAMVIDAELNIENNTLTPSLKLAPNRVLEAYKAHIENLYGSSNPISEEVYVIKLDTEHHLSSTIPEV
ncbi:MAG: AMP-binding protein [Saprospirales bacterium]|nr:AMP-binding protein [Saprospirales bacterium]MBK8920950.1 AMP-binding protein [Saprospirales bacterium]